MYQPNRSVIALNRARLKEVEENRHFQVEVTDLR
jgi:hypothetical protein